MPFLMRVVNMKQLLFIPKYLSFIILFISSMHVFADRTSLPYTKVNSAYWLPTNFIPTDKTAAIECHLPKKNKQKPKDMSYIYVYPYKDKFGGVYRTRYQDNRMIQEVGGKLYLKNCWARHFNFRVDNVSSENEAIVIETFRKGRHALDIHCEVKWFDTKK